MYRNPASGGRAAMRTLVGGTADIRSMLGSIATYVKKKAPKSSIGTCDGIILHMHYKWTLCLFLACFFTVYYSWYYGDVITCVSHFNADTQVRLDYVNLCLSYPYVEKDGARRHILYYRWVHWSFLLLAATYYLTRKISKNLENPKVATMIERVALSMRDERVSEPHVIDFVSQYMSLNMWTHNILFYKYIFANLVALLIDIFTLYFLNFLLQDRFIGYGHSVYPFNRDIRTFSDPMSQTFPPFVMCDINKAKLLASEREEKLGCHLTFMELYEKIFLAWWCWIYILIFVTSLYIVGTLFMFLPCFQRKILRLQKSKMLYHINANITGTISEAVNNMRVGDVYLLYCLKPYLSADTFFHIMKRIGSSQVPYTDIPIPQKTPVHSTPSSVRNRNPVQAPLPHNADYLQNLLNPPSSRPVQRMDAQQRRPLLAPRKESSYLIES